MFSIEFESVVSPAPHLIINFGHVTILFNLYKYGYLVAVYLLIQ